MALADSLQRGRERYPERAALLFEGRAWTYAQLDAITDRIAASLLRLGLQPGDRVALHFTNSPEMVFGYYACFKSGAIAVPLNTRCRGPELEYMLNHAGVRLFIGQDDLFGEVDAIRPRLASVERFYLTGDPSTFPDTHAFEELLVSPEAPAPFPTLPAEAPALIIYTSGTTSRPKGVTHSQHSLERTIAAVVECGFAADEAVGIAAPLCHMAAFGLQLLPALSQGATVVIMPRFEPAQVLHCVTEHQITHFFGLPVMYQSLLDCPGARAGEFGSLKACGAGGDAVPVETHRRFFETFGVAITEGFGMTELLLMSVNPVFGKKKPGSIGLPGPGVRLRLVDEQGRDVPAGEPGEILAQSQEVMAGYWQEPEATAAALRGGWLHTGDLAWCDPDGYYWFAGRKKEIIIRGGSNISPQEVEAALYQHPAVRQAGVVGVPDATWGEVVHAFVALREGAAATEAELRQFAGERLAAYKVPAVIHFLSELPLGATGKVHRKTLREWASAAVGEH